MTSPAFQVYAADFLADKNVAIMTGAEVGAYWLLILYCWREGSLPNDTEELSMLARMDEDDFKKSWNKRISRCFEQGEDGQWRHPRLEAEREKQEVWRSKSAAGGRKSAALKAEAKQEDREAEDKATTLEPPLSHPDTTLETVVEPDANISFSSSFSSSEGEDARAPDEDDVNPLLDALLKVCNLDFEQLRERKRAVLDDVLASLRRYMPDIDDRARAPSVIAFGKYFATLGFADPTPSLGQVAEYWKRFEESLKAQTAKAQKVTRAPVDYIKKHGASKR